MHQPLQQLLLFLKLMAEAMDDLPGTHPGCVVASFAYEAHQFNDEVRELSADGVLSWRQMFLEQFENVAEKHPMKVDESLEALADMLSSVIEGGIVMSKVLKDRSILPNHILQFRNYVRLLFGDV